ncbi:E3 ubiquitin-protein ligase MPSR1 [Brachypodium distachyon]|uniref:RING-type domain-containing protein n=1 Tax=Brachypodium distachyon TaxID=15368 RepID=I1IWI4_BRADI|nr:E3 ubiquitin-protein ligase MPSR1 [Brachypodium distachyon]KQJ81968.1 hypothetical protein BRADI_5g04540v3 [Brachypodium distachyon]|eukprot:XP_003581640.1 E3 ubiquitin-protein ligase MPSR1 [Brachypodium distachyon]
MSYLLSYISKMLCIKIPPSEAKQLDVDGAPTECCVCLSRIRAGEATRRLPCRHAFHRDCVDRWLALCKRTCPLCRVYVVDANSRQAAAAKHSGEPLADDLVIWFSTMLVPGF